jgi:hypothetical protein
MIFYMKVEGSDFSRGASQKASIVHLCTLPHVLTPPPVTPTMSAFASRMVLGKPSAPIQVCIVDVSSSHCVFWKKNHLFWCIFRGEKSFFASVIGGTWCHLVGAWCCRAYDYDTYILCCILVHATQPHVMMSLLIQ